MAWQRKHFAFPQTLHLPKIEKAKDLALQILNINSFCTTEDYNYKKITMVYPFTRSKENDFWTWEINKMRKSWHFHGKTLQILIIRCRRLSTVTPLFYCELRNSALEGTNCENWSDIWTQELILAINLKLNRWFHRSSFKGFSIVFPAPWLAKVESSQKSNGTWLFRHFFAGVTNYAASFGTKKCSENHIWSTLAGFPVKKKKKKIRREKRREGGNPGHF